MKSRKQILNIRREKGLPELKYFHTNALYDFCEGSRGASKREIVTDVHYAGFNPVKGAREVIQFDAVDPLATPNQLYKVADRNPTRKGRWAIDDARRLAVRVCVAPDPCRYRVAVGYWYSRFGALLDRIPRGSE